MAREVWVQLVDAATHGAYAATRPTAVSPVGARDIDAVREACCRDQPDILAGVEATQLHIYANRAAYDDKNEQPRAGDSPIGSLGATRTDALIAVVRAPKVLRLLARPSYPSFLKKAIEIANVMLTHYRYFELELSTDNTTITNLRGVTVVFRQPETSSVYGWTARSKDAKVIHVNDVLLHRMGMIEQAATSHEYQCIVFVVAATIFHECAHLALRWQNILDSPSTFNFEVGDYMEMALFKGACRVKIQQSTRAISKQSKRNRRKWTKEMAILDVVIEANGLSVIRADHLNKFFTPGKLSDKALFPLERASYSTTKGATAFLDGGRKRRRTSPGPNVIIPPLCGISKNRNARRQLSI